MLQTLDPVIPSMEVLALQLATGLAIKQPGRLSRFGILEGDLIVSIDGERCGKGFPRPKLQLGSALVLIRGSEKLRFVLADDAPVLGDGLEESALDMNRAKLLVEAAAQQSRLDDCAARILAARDSGELSDGEVTKLYNMIDRRRDNLREVARAPQLPLLCGPTSATQPVPDEAVETRARPAPSRQPAPRDQAETARREKLDREQFYSFLEANQARGSGHTFEYEPCADHRFAGEGSSALPDSSAAAGAPLPTTHDWYK
jgi:hypothetical protein